MREKDITIFNTTVKRGMALYGKKKWVYGYVWKGADRVYIIPSNLGICSNDNGDGTVALSATAISVFPETVTSSAMCSDRQDKTIYFGDYVQYAGETWEVQFDEKNLAPCLVRNRLLRDGSTQIVPLDKLTANACRVTGSIFEKFSAVRIANKWHLTVDGEIQEDITIPLSTPIEVNDVLAILIAKFHHKNKE